MRSRIVFITGTDTGVGKTVLTSLLARFLRERDFAVAALKPICSGGRNDARILQAALNGAVPLEQINPWSFRAPLAPRLAARQERRRLQATEVLGHVRKVRGDFDIVLIEGAGGLLSPLGEDFDARDLIIALRAIPLIVCQTGSARSTRRGWSSLPCRPPGRARPSSCSCLPLGMTLPAAQIRECWQSFWAPDVSAYFPGCAGRGPRRLR